MNDLSLKEYLVIEAIDQRELETMEILFSFAELRLIGVHSALVAPVEIVFWYSLYCIHHLESISSFPIQPTYNCAYYLIVTMDFVSVSPFQGSCADYAHQKHLVMDAKIVIVMVFSWCCRFHTLFCHIHFDLLALALQAYFWFYRLVLLFHCFIQYRNGKDYDFHW